MLSIPRDGLSTSLADPMRHFFSRPLQNTTELIVPSITIYEVFKTILRQRDESDALQAVALMMQGSVADLTANTAILAAKISLAEKVPMADSIILATARLYQATVWTQDADFKGIAGVQYLPKKP
jgi:predicted nucleic acid-binding protein